MAGNRKRYAAAQWDDMVSAYLEGATQKEAAAIHGATQGGIRRCLKARGIPLHRPADENCFRSMATEEEAYWLGFLYTDGCIQAKANVVSLQLAVKDREHVHKFARFLKARSQPRDREYRNKGKMRRATFFACYSASVVANLIRAGMHDRKTWTITPWDGPPDLMRHFWRGCLDGDGSLYVAKRQRGEWGVAFIGNESMVRGFSAYVAHAGGRPGSTCPHNRPSPTGNQCWSVSWGGNGNARFIASLLYSGAAVYLDRKKAAADAIALTGDHFPFRHATREEMLELFRQHGSWAAISRAVPKSGTLERRAHLVGITEDDLAAHRKSWHELRGRKRRVACE